MDAVKHAPAPLSILGQLVAATGPLPTEGEKTVSVMELGFVAPEGLTPFEVTLRTGKRGRPATVINPDLRPTATHVCSSELDAWSTGINWAKVPGALKVLDATRQRNKAAQERVARQLELLTTSQHSAEYLELIRTLSARKAAEAIIEHPSGEFRGLSFKRLRAHIASLKTG